MTEREKLDKIASLTREKKFAYIKLKDGDEYICDADCFGEEEDWTPNLHVDRYNDKLEYMGFGEILTEADIISVTEYKPNSK